jgi:hypothetical protein
VAVAAGAVVAITLNVAASPGLLIRGGDTTLTPSVPLSVLEIHKLRIGAARIAAGLRQLVRDIALQLLGLLLLALRALLLVLELHLLGLQLRGQPNGLPLWDLLFWTFPISWVSLS